VKHRARKAKSITIAELVTVGASALNTEEGENRQQDPGFPGPVVSFVSARSDSESYTEREGTDTRL